MVCIELNEICIRFIQHSSVAKPPSPIPVVSADVCSKAVVLLLLIIVCCCSKCFAGFCLWSLFWNALIDVLSI